jgi:hypothetical protein
MSVPSIDQLAQILDNGEISPQCDCCPCSNIYVFASVERAVSFLESMGWNCFQEQCTERSYTTSCCTENCLDKLGELYGTALTDIILDKGIYEYSLLGTKSTLCDIYDYLKDNDVPLQDAIDFVSMILDKGIVFQCNGENQILASVTEYLSYAEVAGLINCDNPNPCNCIPSEQCCLSVVANVNTYLVYVEGSGCTGPTPP